MQKTLWRSIMSYDPNQMCPSGCGPSPSGGPCQICIATTQSGETGDLGGFGYGPDKYCGLSVEIERIVAAEGSPSDLQGDMKTYNEELLAVDHHIFPQQFRSWFKERGIDDIDEYCVALIPERHRTLLEGHHFWNAAWKEFKTDNSDASVEQIENFAAELMENAGILTEHIHPWKEGTNAILPQSCPGCWDPSPGGAKCQRCIESETAGPRYLPAV
jgi:hypothetical protein